MRVVHIDTGRRMRGGQWQVLHLMRGLREHGLEQRLLARGDLLSKARAEGFETGPASLSAVWRAKADLFHAHDGRGHTLAAVAGRRPLVVSRRVAFPVKTGALSRWKYSRADGYIAVSEFVRNGLPDPSRSVVIYDGVPPLTPSPCSGRIVAPHFEDSRKAADVVQATGLEVHFSRDLIGDLPGAAVFIYLSEEEGLGSAVLLAMSAGVPVVASRIGGLPEIIDHERTGLLVANDPAQVREAIHRLLDDRGLGERLAQQARKRYLERFTVDHMVDATLAVYREYAG